MAYMDQERKRERMPAIKAVLKKYGMKGSVSVRHHMALVVSLKEGAIDLRDRHEQVNTYWIEKYYDDDPVARDFLLELKDAMLGHDYYNNNDIMTDYFDVSHYIDINIGYPPKNPYVYKPELAEVA